MFNFDIYKDNVKQKRVDDFLNKINKKRKNHKEQILMQPDLHYKPENIENLKE